MELTNGLRLTVPVPSPLNQRVTVLRFIVPSRDLLVSQTRYSMVARSVRESHTRVPAMRTSVHALLTSKPRASRLGPALTAHDVEQRCPTSREQ